MSTQPPPPAESARKQKLPRALRFLQTFFGALVLLGFIAYLITHGSEFDEILAASAFDLSILFLLVGVTLTINVVQNLLLIRRLGVPLSLRESFNLTLATNFGNYLPARAGTLISAHYLKKVHGLSYAQSGSLFGIRIVLTMFAIGLNGLLATLLIWSQSGRFSLILLAMFAAIVAAATLIWFLPLPERRETGGRLRRLILEASLGASRLRSAPALGAFVLSTNLLQQATLVARFYFGTRALGSTPPLTQLLLLSPVASLASLTALTPGALGLREAAMGAATYAVGATFATGMRIGTLDRSVLFLVVGLVGGACFASVWLRIRSSERKQLHL
ncbi:MAG: lysylphosphatidylglycerol synthase transmembrane domain-containing protein [Deltaproteobacteria bacterium]